MFGDNSIYSHTRVYVCVYAHILHTYVVIYVCNRIYLCIHKQVCMTITVCVYMCVYERGRETDID